MAKYNPNQNHPKKGQRISVEPIRKLKDIDAIKKMLASSPRDLALFVLGINNGLRTGDLLKLKVGQVRDLRPGEHITIVESKTGKDNVLLVNKAAHRALQNYFVSVGAQNGDYLFPSRKTKEPISIQTANALVKKWTKAINLKGNYGAHTLRKTFGYIQRTVFKVDPVILTKRFNHSSPAVTMRYLGIADQEVTDILANEI